MSGYHPFTLPDRVLCALGKECLNAKVKYFQWEYGKLQQEQQASGSAGPAASTQAPEPPKQGRQVLIKTALLKHRQGFLDCGHFCCYTAPLIAYKVPSGVRPGVTCKDLHVRCNRSGCGAYASLYWRAMKKNLVPPPPDSDDSGLREELEEVERTMTITPTPPPNVGIARFFIEAPEWYAEEDGGEDSDAISIADTIDEDEEEEGTLETGDEDEDGDGEREGCVDDDEDSGGKEGGDGEDEEEWSDMDTSLEDFIDDDPELDAGLTAEVAAQVVEYAKGYVRGSATERERMKEAKAAYKDMFEKAVAEKAPIPKMRDMSTALVPFKGPQTSRHDVDAMCRRYKDDDRDEDDKATDLMNALRGYDPIFD